MSSSVADGEEPTPEAIGVALSALDIFSSAFGNDMLIF